MNGFDWLNYIKRGSPDYAISRAGVIQRFANKGTRRGDYVQFGPVYQIFMYAFIIGFHQRQRIPLPVSPAERTRFKEIYLWKPEGLVNYVLMLLIANESVRAEAGIDFIAMEDMEENLVKEKFRAVIKIMEEYANAGFGIMEERFTDNPDFFNDPFAFATFLKQMADGKLNAK